MISSMTGFGKAVKIYNNKKITAEIKSLNSKQMDLSVRLPQSYRSIELDLRNTIADNLRRGKVDLYVYSEYINESSSVSLNIPVIQSYKSQIENMSSELGIAEPVDWYATLLRLPDSVISDNNNQEVADEELQIVVDVVKSAIESLKSFREQEGNKLCTFFKEKIQKIQELLNDVAPYEQSRVEKIKERIQESLLKLDGIDYDKNRFEQELIFYIEKLDITEEKLRLQNHLNYFIDTLDNGDGQGKKLGFISQEMGREINTMGSKANQAELQKIVVGMKDHLEQIKEQVLNIL
jgi:uncharacterized protein (TIGR00255 family)